MTLLLETDELQHTGLDLKLRFEFSDTVKITTITTNTSDTALPLSRAIHSYFSVDDIDKLKVTDLKGVTYQDKLSGQDIKQQDELVINQALDRVYLTTQPEVQLVDTKQTVTIGGSAHDSIVIWNPWQQTAKTMADFDDLGYKNMLCVEMANTQGLELEPKEEYSLSQEISII